MNKPRLTAKFVRSILDYDPMTGIFRWKHRENVSARWNTRWAGKIAGSTDDEGRIIIAIGEHKHVKAHRLAFLIMTGRWPKKEVDHRDLDPSNNRWKNIREASRTDNRRNQRIRADSQNRFKGIEKLKMPRIVSERWRARITVAGERINLGTFATPQDAHAAYRRAAADVFGEFARG